MIFKTKAFLRGKGKIWSMHDKGYYYGRVDWLRKLAEIKIVNMGVVLLVERAEYFWSAFTNCEKIN